MYSVKKITLLGIVLVMSVSFSMMNVDRAYGQGSPVYLGEHCWEGGGGFITLGVTHMGDGHVSFCGLSEDWTINGNLEVVGSSALITSTESGMFLGGAIVFSRIATATLDLSTLDGMAYFIETICENGVVTHDNYSFSLSYVDCGSDQSSNGVDKREELIRFLRTFATTPEENLD
jgi:hypothetical protein